MIGANQRRGLVVLVVLLLGLSLVAPVAAGPNDGGTTSGDSFGDSLDGSDDSTDDSSTDDSGSSDGDSTPDSGPGSDSRLRSSSEDGASDPDSGSGLESSLDDGSSDADSDEERALDDSVLPGETNASLRGQISESLSTVMPDRTSGADGSVSGTSGLVGLDTTATSRAANDGIELPEIDDTDTATLELTTTTTEVLSTVGTLGDSVATSDERLTTGTSGDASATTGTARFGSSDSDPLPPVDGGTASVEAREPPSTGGDAATGRNAISFPVSEDDLPGGPAGAGATVGLAGAAAAIAARQSGALSGMTGGLGTTARTAAGSVPGSSHVDRLVRTLAPFRYSRYDDSDPLEHEARDAMFDVVERSPGTYLSEIAERAGLPLSTARHHIRVLEREDLITGAKVRGKRRFYPAHTDGVELAAAMNDESTAAVIDALARLGAASVSDLADELGKDPSTVTHHVQRLEEDEVVVREREGRAVMNKLSAAARTMLEPDEGPAEGLTTGETIASD